jgi:hypothetical protein
MRDEQHGSLSQPKKHLTLVENSSVKELLDQLRTIRADLRFREDGIHTTLRVDRQALKK